MGSIHPDKHRGQVGFPHSSERRSAHAVASPAAKGVDVAAVWSALRAGKWLILGCVVLATSGALTYSTLVTPVFESSTVLSIAPQSSTQLPGSNVQTGQISIVSSEIGTLQKSTELAQRVLARLEETARSIGTTEFFPLLRDEGESGLAPWEELAGRMRFGAMGVDMIVITAESSAPEEATQLATLYAGEYVDHSRERARASLVAAREFLESQVEQSEAALMEVQREYERYSRERDIVAQGAGGERIVTEYQSMYSRRDEIRFERRRLMDANEILKLRVEGIEPGTLETNEVRDQARLGYLTTLIGQLQADIEPWYTNDPSLRGNESRQPQLKQKVDRVAQLEGELRQLQRMLLERTRTDPVTPGSALQKAGEIRAEIERNDLLIRQYEADEVDLSQRLATLASRMDRIPSQVFQVEEIELRRGREQSYLQGLRDRLREYTIAEQAELGFVSILRPATLPTEPVSPDLQGNLVMALLLGTVFGAALAFLRAAVSNHLQSPDDVEHLGYRLLGVVPSMRREIQSVFKGRQQIEINGRIRSATLVTLHSPWSPASEHYRLVRTNLQSIARGENMRVILVTSPEPADGKTVSSVNLAVSLAQNGSRTLLIDCDLRKASIARVLGVERSPGVGEILTTEVTPVDEFESCKTDIENLYCLPAGRVASPPPELLGSETMVQLLELAREHFDVVIVDSPPVLAVTDAVILAPLCDAAVIVVAANKTSPRGVRTTITTLENLGVNIAGVVFNQFNQSRSAAGYYEYQYGYAYAEESDS